MKHHLKRPAFILALAMLMLFASLAAAESNHLHQEAAVYTPLDERTHEVSKYCSDPDCGMELARYDEKHLFSEGRCSKCGYACPHNSSYTETIAVEGEDDYRWDGAYLTYTVLKITCCETCGQELGREVKEEKLLHETHTDPVHISYTNQGPNSHSEMLTCSLCGTTYSVTEPHQWVRSGCYATDSDDTHTVVMHCTQCGAVEERNEKHSTREARWEIVDRYDCIQVLQCTACRKEIRTEPVPHEKITVQWISGGENTHNKIVECVHCSYSYIVQAEPHNMKRGVCTLCGEKEQPGHTHISWVTSKYISCSAEKHYSVALCDTCGQPLEDRTRTLSHHFDKVTGVCYECGYARDGHAHDVDMTWNEALSDDTRHVSSGVCKVCGTTVMVSGEHHSANMVSEYVDDETERQYGTCSECGHKMVILTYHNASEVINQHDSETHWRYCYYCAHKLNESRHAYVEKNGKLCCDVCGYEREAEPPHEHELVYSHAIPVPNGRCCYQVYVCSQCGVSFSKQTEHERNESASYEPLSKEEHIAAFRCVNCGKNVSIYENHIIENDICVYCGAHVHIHQFEECRSNVNPHLYYYQCRCGEIEREEIRPCELQSHYHALSETQHEFRYECIICGSVKGRNTTDHVFVSGSCEMCGYVPDTPIPVENDLLPGAAFPDAVVSYQSGGSEVTLRGSLLSPWHVLAIDGEMVECLPDVFLPEGAEQLACVLRPANVPEDGFYEMLLDREQMQVLVSSGIASLRVLINGHEILILEDVTSALRRMDEQKTKELMIFFCLNPDAPEGVRDTSAYLFVSSLFDLFEMEKNTETEMITGLEF